MNKLSQQAVQFCLLLLLFCSGCRTAPAGPPAAAREPYGPRPVSQTFPVAMSEQEWQKKLPEPVFNVLRLAATEPPFSNPLTTEKGDGEYRCLGCEKSLFDSRDKFDSGTGWPSFDRPANSKSVATMTDNQLGNTRTEVHCADCGGHLGHVFNDGPTSTGLRYCINGTALDFVSRKAP